MSFDDAKHVLDLDYRLTTFLVSLGVIELAAARSSLTGLWLVRSRQAVRRIGWSLMAAGLLVYLLLPLWQSGPWAMASDPTTAQAWHTASPGDLTAAHNVSDTMGGLSGNTQALLLITSAVAASLVAALFGALTVRRLRVGGPSDDAVGIEALEGGNLLDAARSAWSRRGGQDAPAERGSPARAGPEGPS